MASPPLKKHILSVFESAVKREPNIPFAMKQYLCSTFRVVSKSVPKAGQFCQSYRPRISTRAMRDYVQNPPKCSCADLHARYGVPVVEGHCFTRSFEWLSNQFPSHGKPAVLHQNLKNGLLPSWRSIYKDASTQISRALDDINRLSALERRRVVSEVLNTLRREYMSMKSSTPDTHTVTAMQSQLQLLPREWVCGCSIKAL